MGTPPPNSILDDKGRVLPEVLAARRRGIWFDFGNGVAAHFNWEMVESGMTQGFWPDTFSTDWSATSRTTGVVDFANVISKFLMFGMPLDQVIARATLAPARVFPAFNERGTLGAGGRRCPRSQGRQLRILG
jgi:dihydroorotase